MSQKQTAVKDVFLFFVNWAPNPDKMEERVTIDVIILSYAQTEALKQMTINCLNSLAESGGKHIYFKTIVIESEKAIAPYQYPHSKTIYPDQPFGYHRYMNIGIKMGTAEYVCICNNDLIFHKEWATEILKPFTQFSDVSSASPICSINHPAEGFKVNDGIKIGYRIRKELAGWCIFFKRDILKLTGMLDENYIFWCADNDYANTLWTLKLNHVLVTSAIVDHLENKTLHSQTPERQLELTEQECIYYDKKWKHRDKENWIAM